VPFAHGNTALRWRYAVEELEEASGAASGERKCHVRGVDDPTQDFLDGVPGGITLAKLLDGYGFLPMGVGRS
jgi:hypothetical protein